MKEEDLKNIFLQENSEGVFTHNDLINNQNTLRGYILFMTVQIERKIDNYLSTHFCASSKKKNQINELIFFTERITLDMKRQVFVSLLKANESPFLKENPDFLKVLENIVPHRNIFAHLETYSLRELSWDDRKKLVFKKYSNGELRPKRYEQKDISDLQTDLMYIDFSLDLILQELPPLI